MDDKEKASRVQLGKLQYRSVFLMANAIEERNKTTTTQHLLISYEHHKDPNHGTQLVSIRDPIRLACVHSLSDPLKRYCARATRPFIASSRFFTS